MGKLTLPPEKRPDLRRASRRPRPCCSPPCQRPGGALFRRRLNGLNLELDEISGL
jgi:hypothetical protein